MTIPSALVRKRPAILQGESRFPRRDRSERGRHRPALTERHAGCDTDARSAAPRRRVRQRVSRIRPVRVAHRAAAARWDTQGAAPRGSGAGAGSQRDLSIDSAGRLSSGGRPAPGDRQRSAFGGEPAGGGQRGAAVARAVAPELPGRQFGHSSGSRTRTAFSARDVQSGGSAGGLYRNVARLYVATAGGWTGTPGAAT